MLAKLAVRNVKRQISNYIIYFITVSLTVALMFAVNSVIFEKQLIARAENIKELRSGLILITVFISAIVAFMLGYATSFMLKLRKREFGTYLTLGMTRGNILRLFVLESLILCAVSLVAGILLGLLFYQGLMQIVTSVMEVEFTFAAYSFKGFLLTVCLVLAIFVLSSLTSAVYLKRVSIYNLLHGAQKQEKVSEHPVVWLVITVVSLGAIIFSCVKFSQTMKLLIKGSNEKAGFLLVLYLLIVAVGIVLFHIGLSKSAVNILLKSKKFKNRGTNAFTLRKLSGKLGSSAVMAGGLGFLLAFAVIGANLSFVMQIGNKVSLDKNYPFDISAEFGYGIDVEIPFERAEQIIAKYTNITDKTEYTVYGSDTEYLCSFTQDERGGYEIKDHFIAESDYNALFGKLGKPKLTLNNEFKIFPFFNDIKGYDFSDAVFEFGGVKYPFSGFVSNDSRLHSNMFFLAVVPDSVVGYLKKMSYGAAYTLSPAKYDANSLRAELTYHYTTVWEGYEFSFDTCDYYIREYERLMFNAQNAVYIVAALYVAVVFVFMCMAILALKTLSGIADDKRRYDILYKLGASKSGRKRTLFAQTFVFFFLPFVLPLLMSIPVGIICAQVLTLAGFISAVGKTAASACAIAAVITAIYILYFSATYLLARRTVIKE